MIVVTSDYFEQDLEPMKLMKVKKKDILTMLSEYVLKGDLFNLKYELAQLELAISEGTKSSFEIDNIHPETGRTLLIEAVANGYYEIVKFLVEECSCNINKRSVLGRSSPLHVAVEHGHRQVASFLILLGAEINAIDKYGCTPLHLVPTLTIAKMLQKFGADCLIRNKIGHQASQSYRLRSSYSSSTDTMSIDQFNQPLYDFLSDWEYTTEMQHIHDQK